jgi:hypothetical protein
MRMTVREKRSQMPRFVASVFILLCGAGVACAQASGVALRPAFPNYALVPARPAAAGRDTPVGPPDVAPPFSWTQVEVVREGETRIQYLHGFDPDLQPLRFTFPQLDSAHVHVLTFSERTGEVDAHILPNSGGTTDSFPFHITAREIDSDTYNLIYDIRPLTARIRTTPIVTRSAGVFIRPGQIVRYSWTQTSYSEKKPKCEALLAGRTGPATGSSQSFLTSVLGVKVQPAVLGHYLMLVTPRDVRGEPPRGSMSNGVVFQCAFGSDNLPPVTDGLSADAFAPGVGQTVTLAPVATDPETGQTVFTNQLYEFGDGSALPGIDGATTHAYSVPGIYRARCTVTDVAGLSAVAEDSFVVGATVVTKLAFKFKKNIPPEEAGAGLTHEDQLQVTFKNANAHAGDRIIFLYNRNQFGRLSASDAADDTDIVLKHGGAFSGATRLAQAVTVKAAGSNLSINIARAQFDRTGDPRFNRAELKGIFRHQRIAVAVIPTVGAPRVLAYLGNMQIKVKGGQQGNVVFIAEESVSGNTTPKEPDPKKQEDY